MREKRLNRRIVLEEEITDQLHTDFINLLSLQMKCFRKHLKCVFKAVK